MEQAKIGPKTALETWRKSKDHPSSPNSPTQSKDVTRPDTAMIPHKKWVVDHTITLIHTPNSRMKVIKPFAITHIGVAQKNRSKISHDISVSYWEIISCNLGVVTMAFGHCLRAHVQEYVSCFWYHMQWWGLTGYDVTSASWTGYRIELGLSLEARFILEGKRDKQISLALLVYDREQSIRIFIFFYSTVNYRC